MSKQRKQITVGSHFEEFFACDLQPYRLNRDVNAAHNRKKAAEIAAHFNEAKFGYPIVRRNGDGILTIVDGHNRLAALEILDWDDYVVMCEVFDDMDDRGLAELFLGRGDRKAYSSITLFQNRLAAKEQTAVAIVGILAEFGLHVAESRGKNSPGVAAVKTLDKIYSIPGVYAHRGEVLRATIGLLTGAWGAGSALVGDIIEGTGFFMARHGKEIDIESLRSRLSGRSGGPTMLLGNARGLHQAYPGSVAHHVAHVLTLEYNKGRRSRRLPDWR